MTAWHVAILTIVVTTVAIRIALDLRQGVARSADRFVLSLSFVTTGCGVLVISAQLFGVDILPMPRTALEPYVRGCGILLGIVAAAAMTWTRMLRATTWAGPEMAPGSVCGHFLATTGPYRYIRHPYYACCLLGIIAIELAIASWFVIVVVPLAITFADIDLAAEERELEKVYGDEYRAYSARAWRLIPLIY